MSLCAWQCIEHYHDIPDVLAARPMPRDIPPRGRRDLPVLLVVVHADECDVPFIRPACDIVDKCYISSRV